MNNIVSANLLKTRGISAVRKVTAGGTEAVITVRGRKEYVILPLESYNRLRECELEIALREAREDIRKGKYVRESVEKHMRRIKRA